MAFVYANFLDGVLQSAVDSDDVLLVLGATFGAQLPVLGVGDTCALTLSDGQQAPEIVYCTSNSGGNLTVTRGEEDTVPAVWSAGTRVRGALTAAMLDGVLSPVISVNGRDGAVVLTKADVGLSNVDNTSDINKPVSTATQAALDALEAAVAQDVLDTVQPLLDEITASVNLKAPLASPSFTGNATFAGNVTIDGTLTVGGASLQVPSGSIIMHAANAAPAGYLECSGAAVSRTTYSALFNAIGTTWGVGDGTTTFNLPNLRGEFPRGWDNGRGVDSGRSFASAQSSQNLAHTHTTTFNYVQGDSGDGSRDAFSWPGADGDSGVSPASPYASNSSGGTEARPRNIALLFCIKT